MKKLFIAILTVLIFTGCTPSSCIVDSADFFAVPYIQPTHKRVRMVPFPTQYPSQTHTKRNAIRTESLNENRAHLQQKGEKTS